jgi:hypothetical protein
MITTITIGMEKVFDMGKVSSSQRQECGLLPPMFNLNSKKCEMMKSGK